HREAYGRVAQAASGHGCGRAILRRQRLSATASRFLHVIPSGEASSGCSASPPGAAAWWTGARRSARARIRRRRGEVSEVLPGDGVEPRAYRRAISPRPRWGGEETVIQTQG